MDSPPTQPDDASRETPLRFQEEPTAHLVRGARAGDAGQFNALYEKLAPSLYTWAELRIGPKLRGWLDPADLVQEVWFRALRSVNTLDEEEISFRYWIFRIAKNALLEALRKSESPGVGLTRGSGTARVDPLGQIPDSVTAVSRRLARSEDLKRFSAWIDELEEEDRELVIHVGLEGMAHAQVGVRLGLLPKTVTKRWQRLRERLEATSGLIEMLGE